MRAKLAVIDEYGVLDPDAKVAESSLPDWLTKAGVVSAEMDEDDTAQNLTRRLNFVDYVGGKGSVINIDHRADGSGKTGVGAGQTYALDIHNYPGATRAMVVHQYSSVAEAIRLDNTGSKAMIRIVNTENQTLNPGGDGTGEPIIFDDHGTVRFKLQGDGAIYTEPKDTSHGIWVKSPTTGTKSSVYVDHRAPSPAVQIIAAAGSAGSYPLIVGGQNYGPAFTTSTDGGSVLNLTKNGTGSGVAINVTNKGTGATITLRDAVGIVSQITAAGEYENLVNGKGILVKSPNGTRYRIAVADGGALSAVTA